MRPHNCKSYITPKGRRRTTAERRELARELRFARRQQRTPEKVYASRIAWMFVIGYAVAIAGVFLAVWKCTP